ncbi:MAG: CehA/McbA family metallohydrolase [Polyangiales bacterium]
MAASLRRAALLPLAVACAAPPRPAPRIAVAAPPPAVVAPPLPARVSLRVRVPDADTAAALPVRVVFRGLAPTGTPDLGPVHRASGAGPVVVAVRGEATVSVPPGRYRVAASHGPEWSLGLSEVDLRDGRDAAVDLALRHELPMPAQVPCDLHVHARPSYDSQVSVEDRVASLVAEGVRFAVPTEHNIVGDYAPGVAALPAAVRAPLAWVPAVEVTTDPRDTPLGHFNVYPYPPAPGVVNGGPPPWVGVTAREVFLAARQRDPDAVLQVNHPRMAPGIGYFDLTGLDPWRNVARSPAYDPGYTALEVFNGLDLGDLPRVEAVLADYMALLGTGARYVATGSSDSHNLAFQTAGYPRTYVDAPGDDGEGAADVDLVLRGLRAGRAMVTAGPMVRLAVEGRGPGESLEVDGVTPVRVRVQVTAASWVTVREAALWRDGQRVAVFAVAPSTAPRRFDRTVTLDVAPGDTLLATARGEARSLEVVMPWSRATPFAFTNPVRITPRAAGIRRGATLPARP